MLSIAPKAKAVRTKCIGRRRVRRRASPLRAIVGTIRKMPTSARTKTISIVGKLSESMRTLASSTAKESAASAIQNAPRQIAAIGRQRRRLSSLSLSALSRMNPSASRWS